MSGNTRPLSVTLLGLIYIGMGVTGIAYHFSEIQAKGVIQYAGVLVECLSLLAIICGAFMLRGRNWARWLALAWMVLHVIVSAFHSIPEFVIHFLFCAVIAWVLFRPEGAKYFERAKVSPSE